MTFFLAIVNIFVFLAFVTFSIVPVLIQLFIHPFSVVLVYSYYLAVHVLFFTVVFLLTFLWKKTGLYTISLRLSLLLMLPTAVIVCIAIISFPFAALYQIITSGSLSDNQVVAAAASLLPSLIVTSPLLLLKNRLIPILTAPEDEKQEEEDAEDDDVVEEGTESRERKGSSELDKEGEGGIQTLKVM